MFPTGGVMSVGVVGGVRRPRMGDRAECTSERESGCEQSGPLQCSWAAAGHGWNSFSFVFSISI